MSKNKKGNLTKVGPANKDRTSVKTSIPTYLAAKYGIEAGATLEWNDNGEFMIIRVCKEKKSEEKRQKK